MFMSKFSPIMKHRGALIVFEGVDRCGKSTQTQLMSKWLNEKGDYAKLLKFPDRDSAIGSTIDQYLREKSQLTDEVIHLLFSCNRWEAVPTIIKCLNEGTTLIIDRYAFSGVAYSAAKGLDFHWCQQPDVGLPKPDAVVFLDLSPSAALNRSGYGDERYEKLEFQTKVYESYKKMIDPSWLVVDASDSSESLHGRLRNDILKIIEESKSKPLLRLWKEEKEKTFSNGR